MSLVSLFFLISCFFKENDFFLSLFYEGHILLYFGFELDPSKGHPFPLISWIINSMREGTAFLSLAPRTVPGAW